MRTKANTLLRAAVRAQKKPHKYHAQAVVVDGIRFASKAEARRYGELKLLQKTGEIRRLAVQPGFDLAVHGVEFIPTGLPSLIGQYRGDFFYERLNKAQSWGEAIWERVVEDVKSPATRTALYRWKVKHLKAQYGIDVREVM